MIVSPLVPHGVMARWPHQRHAIVHLARHHRPHLQTLSWGQPRHEQIKLEDCLSTDQVYDPAGRPLGRWPDVVVEVDTVPAGRQLLQLLRVQLLSGGQLGQQGGAVAAGGLLRGDAPRDHH